jgi:predicted nucleic acid-binding protein
MPKGKRRDLLTEHFELFIKTAFEQRILPFDIDAARIYGDVLGHRRDIGRPISSLDGQIAAIARSRGFSVATRNIKDFEECQIDLINPFAYD